MSLVTRDVVFIQANPQQMLGAKVAAHAAKRNSKSPDSFDVFIMDANDHSFLSARDGQAYQWNGKSRIWRMDDLQSFTPLRFMPPELQEYRGRAVVIDPDCFILGDIRELFDMDMAGKAIWCAKRGSAKSNNRTWATSVMLLDCAQLGHWRTQEQFNAMFDFTRDYVKWINLKYEPADSIGELPRIWNDLDRLTPETRILHNTRRRTQPWKTGLPVDFSIRKRPAGFWGQKWMPWSQQMATPAAAEGTYKPHPDPAQEQLFFTLLQECIDSGSITHSEIQAEMAMNHIRHDTLEVIADPARLLRRPAVAKAPAVEMPNSRVTQVYLGAVAAFVAVASLAVVMAPDSLQMLAIDDGPLDQLSAVCCLVAVALAFGTIFQPGVRRFQWSVLATMQIGLIGFLNAKGNQAGPLPYEFSELIGFALEPDNLAGETWSALLITGLLFVFLIYALTRYRSSESVPAANRVLLSALLVAVFTPLAGDLIGDSSETARVIVDSLELSSSAGFALAAFVSLKAVLVARSADARAHN